MSRPTAVLIALLASLYFPLAMAGAALVKDIGISHGSSPANFVTLQPGVALFSAPERAVGILWRTDGTTAGTQLLSYMAPWPTQMAALNGLVYFTTHSEPWVSDGTSAGTRELKDIFPGADARSEPTNYVATGTRMFFVATSTSGRELWTSMGTTASTVEVLDINAGSADGEPMELVALGDTLYFSADDGIHGRELWRSDGTPAGTYMVRDVIPGPAGSSPTGLTVAGGMLYFVAPGGGLMKSDGTLAGTVPVTDGISVVTRVHSLAESSGVLYYFRGNREVDPDYDLGRINPATGLAEHVKAAVATYQKFNAYEPAYATAHAGRLYFVSMGKLWLTDGTEAGTRMLPVGPLAAKSGPMMSRLISVGPFLYFDAYELNVFQEVLWRTDGTDAGTLRVGNVCAPAPFEGQPAQRIALGGALLLGAYTCLQPPGQGDTELWKVDPSTGGVAASPASVHFGGQSIDTTSRATTVVLTNSDAVAVTVDSITASGPFEPTHDCGTLAPGQSCSVAITFTPLAEGALGGTLTVASAGGNTFVALAGIGERSLATHYYQSILGRAPDAAGKAYWNDQAALMQQLGANRNETWYAMALAFFGSAEYDARGRNDSDFVGDLYRAFFNRAPDPSGQAYWSGQLGERMPREVLLVSFLFSQEFTSFTQGIFGNTPVRAEIDVVMDFYRGLLHRLPDSAGFNTWLQRFRTAQCTGAGAVYDQVETISRLFADSAEYANRHTTDAQYVGDLYNTFLRRGGDLDGVEHWIELLSSGAATRDSLRRQFIQSAEFSARVNAVVSQGCRP